jgi:predicted Zn-dependent protease
VGVLLPFSRQQESEADHLGMILMAKAGYDPHAALDLWKRMAEIAQGQRPPEWLSTHPSEATRVERIQGWLPEAMSYYKPAR